MIASSSFAVLLGLRTTPLWLIIGLTLSSCAIEQRGPHELAIAESYSPLVKAFGSLPLISSIKLSPSGRHIAVLINGETGTGLVTRRVDGTDEHAVLSTDNQKRSEERRVGKECRSRWSPYH